MNDAEIIARELDRLAYLVDPYEYWDVIGGRGEEDIERNIRQILTDLRSGNWEPYVDWLRELIDDDSTAWSDQCRARSRLDHLMTWINS